MSRLTTFSPALLSAWETAASRGTFHIPCGKGEEGRKKATRLRFRLYDLRRVVERERKDLHDIIKTISISLTHTHDGEYILVLDNSDKSLEDLLLNAGVEVPPAPDFPD